MKIPLIGQTNNTQSRDVDYQLTQNWYPAIEQTGRNSLVLYPTPGLTEFAEAGTGPVRGMIEYGDFLFVVSGTGLYEVTSGGGVTLRGTLNTAVGAVSMAHNGAFNGKQICIVDGADLYIWDASGSDFKVITDSADPDYDADCPDKATHVVFMDGYFIVNDPDNSGRFYQSASYDGTTWTNTGFATAERDPDELNAIAVNGRELWLLGEHTSEVWYNAGTTPIAFAPMSSAYIDMGCVAPHSVATYTGSLFWLSQTEHGEGQVVMVQGLSPKVISTTGISEKIRGLSRINDARGYVYQHNNHVFYVLNFPEAGNCVVYDISTGMWHEWTTGSLGHHRALTFSYFNNKHIVGDYSSGKLYELDYDKYTDNGVTITRKRRTQHIHAQGKKVFHKKLELVIQSGVGDNTTPNPQMMMRYSDDGGYTYSQERWRSMGAVGEYNKRLVWNLLGSSDDRVYEFSVTDPVNAVIIDGYADIAATADEIKL